MTTNQGIIKVRFNNSKNRVTLITFPSFLQFLIEVHFDLVFLKKLFQNKQFIEV